MDGIQDFVGKLQIVTTEYLGKYMRNKYRQRRVISKLYHDMSLIIHIANQTFQELGPKGATNPCYQQMSIDLGLNLMIDQLELGYAQELYSQIDYLFISFYLDYTYGLLDNNYKNMVFMNQEFIKLWQMKQYSKARNMASSMFIQKFYTSFLVKAKYVYLRVLSRALYLVISKKMFILDFEKDNQQLHIRFQNRFKIFDNVYFLKKVKFDELKSTCESDLSQFENLAQKTEHLKQQFMEANKSLEILTDDGLCPEKIKKQAQKIKRISVLSAIQITKLNKQIDQNIKFRKLVAIDHEVQVPFLSFE